jgi:hypothetical protein
MTNFRVGHETNVHKLGALRLNYQKNFIEIDNRLAWILGRLNERFGKDARYVHLTRNPEEIAQSYNKRWHMATGIIPAYRSGVLMLPRATPIEICRDYVETVNANIRYFLEGKPHVLHVALENIEVDFSRFWEWISAEGDQAAALGEWETYRNTNIE